MMGMKIMTTKILSEMDADDLYAMYGEQPVEPKINKTIVKPLENKNAATRRINVGIVGYDVPTVEHVAMLHKKIQNLEHQIDTQDSKIRRLENSLNRLRNDLMKTHTNIGNLNRELDQKIDRRD